MAGIRAIGTSLRAWTPAQLAALAFGYWWTLNGIAVLTVGGTSLSALGAHGKVTLLGLSIAVNGWHGLFHLSTGLTGLAVCAWPKVSRIYALAAGGLYLVVALSGAVSGNSALAVIYVDTLGSVVHAVEGLAVLAAGVVSSPRYARRRSVIAHSRYPR